MTIEGINIFSGAPDPLGAALTNPTELARKKGTVAERYGVQFLGKAWPDVEGAYLALKTPNEHANNQLMVELIAAKLQQHPSLIEDIQRRGGLPFLLACSHWTGARSEHFKAWEGDGLKSRFIRNLVAAYKLCCSTSFAENGQLTLSF